MTDNWAGLDFLKEGEIIQNWKKLQNISISDGETRWIFRGQSSAENTLASSLERSCNRLGLEKVYDVETTLLREFMRRFHHYSNYTPLNEIEWFSIMRHYGAPTRFLDWSYSLHVATYFALEQCRENDFAAIWAIDLKWLHDKCREQFNILWKEPPPTRLEQIIWEKPNDFREVFGGYLNPWIAPVNSFGLNERVSIQLGSFIAPCDLKSSFMENVAALEPSENQMKKFIIPYNLRLSFLERLHQMNISQASLFPGLDGFAESLGIYSPLVVNAGQGKSTDRMAYRGKTYLSSSNPNN